MTTVLVTAEGDTIDLIAWRAYGDRDGQTGGDAPPAGTVEALYAANPGLARRPLPLPAGLTLRVPEDRPWPARPPIRLWD